jgi:Domain of unknown function (DUF2383)
MALTSTAMADMLSSLVQLDIRAVYAYRQAIPMMGAGGGKNQLIRFQTDHERHIHQLSAVIRALDSEPPSLTSGFKGFLMQGVTEIRSLTGLETSLCAIKVGEELTNQLYGKSCSGDFTPSIKELVTRNFADEQRHLKYLEEVFFTVLRGKTK